MSDAVRRVWIAPVLHDAVDLGDLRHRVDPARAAEIDRFWSILSGAILGSDLRWPDTDLFVDGLPVCGKELEIVKDLARQGSANHRLVNLLVARGASLHGTESPELLVRELALHRTSTPDPAEARRLLVERDRFMASRIVSELGPGRTGLLFVGAAHAVDRALAELVPDLPVQFPFGRPSRAR